MGNFWFKFNDSESTQKFLPHERNVLFGFLFASIYVFLSDEIYTDLIFCNKYESFSKFYPEGTFISGGLSKWCGAGGWRVGFFAVPKNLSNFLETIVTLASESYSTVNTPAQYAAVQAYEGDFTEYKSKTLNILRSVGNYVYNNLKSNKVLINQPQGAFYLMPEFLNKKFKNSTHLCETVLEETGVAMLPASDFGFNSKRLLTRLCYIDFDGNEFLKADINEKNIRKYLQTRDIPDPDLLIRTGNTKRLSNFLLWQLAYSEIFFEKKLWPEFNENDFNKIIRNYKKVKRNFGNI